MKKIVSLFLIVLELICILCSCKAKDDKIDKPRYSSNYGLTYYALEGVTDSNFVERIKRYNKYCIKNNLDDSYRIEVVHFDSAQELRTQLSVELMSGGGCDIFSLGQMLPYEKLAQNGAFADFNELIASDKSKNNIDLSMLNEKAMDAGVFNGKRYILPVSYIPDVLFFMQGSLDTFGIDCKNGDEVLYKDIPKIFESFVNDNKGYNFRADSYELYEDLCKLADSNIDYANKKVSFETQDFKESAAAVKKLYDSFNYYDDWELSAEKCLTDLYTPYYPLNMGGGSSVVLKGFLNSKNTFGARIYDAVAINKNCKNMEQAFSFAKYLMSEEGQYSHLVDYGAIPVNKKAYENVIEETKNKKDSGRRKSIGYDTEFMQTYLNIVENADTFSLYSYPAYSYYISEIASESLHNYLDGKITEDKLAAQLTSSAQLYFME